MEVWMGQILVRKLGDDVKERLRARAKRNGRTLEAEARAVLEEAATATPVEEPKRFGLGTELLALQCDSELTQEDWEAFERSLQENRKDFKVRVIDFD
jgi:antitoxin FitA